MPLIPLLVGLLFPRLAIAYLWFFTGWFRSVFSANILWPLLGFIFAPYTLLWYTAVQNWYSGTWGIWQIIILVVAIIADLSSSRGVL
ncbi:MAG: hypothetical protein Q8P35_03045 [Candidatus Yanofskybacteria bacterium]|nr:hypothetical protein [Candidatus Yanofskybacteria bacterium]